MIATTRLDQRFADAMGQMLGPDFPSDLVLAVSGGGDSMAMMALAHNWARVWGVRLWVVTIDHGLRPASADEARMVAQEARLLGHPHAALKWRWDGTGNMQAEARQARLTLINRWRGVLSHVLMAHTKDDVAETFLLRLARQAGVEGLSEMQRSRRVARDTAQPLPADQVEGDSPPRPASALRSEFWVHRPCLDMSRDELRHYARTLHVPWVDDPSNADPQFDRVKMRQARPHITQAGLSTDALVSAAQHMARAAHALRLRAAARFAEIGRECTFGDMLTGAISMDRDGFASTERDTQLRLLSYAVTYVSCRPYRPREAAVEALCDRLLAGGNGTLHGCELRTERETLRVFREYAAVSDHVAIIPNGAASQLWDNRFMLTGHPHQSVRALGPDGWGQLSQRPDGAPSFQEARCLPALWEGDKLVSCPLLHYGTAQQSYAPFGDPGMTFGGFCLSH